MRRRVLLFCFTETGTGTEQEKMSKHNDLIIYACFLRIKRAFLMRCAFAISNFINFLPFKQEILKLLVNKNVYLFILFYFW